MDKKRALAVSAPVVDDPSEHEAAPKEGPKKEGWVLKQGPPPWKTWKKRWLVLSPTGLTYFSVKGKEKKTMKGSVPANMITTVVLVAINKKKGVFGFKVDVPTRTYIFAPQPEKLSLSERAAQAWVDAVTQLMGDSQARRKQVQKVSTLKKKKKRDEPSRSASVLEWHPPASNPPPRRVSVNDDPSWSKSQSPSSTPRNFLNKEGGGDVRIQSENKGNKKKAKQEDEKSGNGRIRSEKRTRELKELDAQSEAEIQRIVEKYSTQRQAIIDALLDKEISSIRQRYSQKKQAILAQIKVKSVQV